MPLLSSLIGGLSSLFGGLFSSRGQSSANKTNLHIAEMQNRLNYQMFKEQNEFNLAQYERNNAYNTPLAQRQRYEEAGINPALALGNISSGTATAVTSATPAPAQGATMQNALAPLGDGIAQAGNTAINTYLQAQRQQADIDKIKADTANMLGQNRYLDARSKAEISKIVADTKKSLADTDMQKFNLDYLRDAAPHQIEAIKADINYKVSQSAVNSTVEKLNMDVLSNVRPLERAKLRAEIGNIIQNTHYLVLQGRVSVEQANSLIQSVTESKARTMGIDINNKQVQAMFQPTLRNLNAQTQLYGAQVRNTDKRTHYMSQENARGWINSISGGIRDIGIAVGSVGGLAKDMGAFTKPLSPIGFRQ